MAAALLISVLAGAGVWVGVDSWSERRRERAAARSPLGVMQAITQARVLTFKRAVEHTGDTGTVVASQYVETIDLTRRLSTATEFTRACRYGREFPESTAISIGDDRYQRRTSDTSPRPWTKTDGEFGSSIIVTYLRKAQGDVAAAAPHFSEVGTVEREGVEYRRFTPDRTAPERFIWSDNEHHPVEILLGPGTHLRLELNGLVAEAIQGDYCGVRTALTTEVLEFSLPGDVVITPPSPSEIGRTFER
jgi:hypothetical protein